MIHRFQFPGDWVRLVLLVFITSTKLSLLQYGSCRLQVSLTRRTAWFLGALGVTDL